MFSSLQDIIAAGRDVSTDELNQPPNRGAALELQVRLCDLGLLDPTIDGDRTRPFGPVGKGDGKLGVNTRAAVFKFCQMVGLPYVDRHISAQMVQLLSAAQPDTFLPIVWEPREGDSLQTRIAKCVLRYMRQKGYWIARSPRMRNIVYVEGMNANGSLNADRPNEWNDRRMVIRIAEGGQPEMLVNDQATSEPGKFYTWHPTNPRGVARIAFGQYKAWVKGRHHGRWPALVQRERVKLHRDLNRDSRRNASDPIDIGKTFGINQHSTSPDRVPEFVNSFSAGCLVGRRYAWHLSFLDIVQQDPRYLANEGYLFITTVIAGDDLPPL